MTYVRFGRITTTVVTYRLGYLMVLSKLLHFSRTWDMSLVSNRYALAIRYEDLQQGVTFLLLTFYDIVIDQSSFISDLSSSAATGEG